MKTITFFILCLLLLAGCNSNTKQAKEYSEIKEYSDQYDISGYDVKKWKQAPMYELCIKTEFWLAHALRNVIVEQAGDTHYYNFNYKDYGEYTITDGSFTEYDEQKELAMGVNYLHFRHVIQEYGRSGENEDIIRNIHEAIYESIHQLPYLLENEHDLDVIKISGKEFKVVLKWSEDDESWDFETQGKPGVFTDTLTYSYENGFGTALWENMIKGYTFNKKK